MSPLKIAVIVGSTRPKRFSEKPAGWIFEEVKKIDGVEAELLDLRDWPLPFYDEPASPLWLNGEYSTPVAKQWEEKIQSMDAYIIVAPEYNHGTSAVLKNALDYTYTSWNKKPVGFVSYGSVGGGRAVEHLRLVAVELQMAPIRLAVHIPWSVIAADTSGEKPWDPATLDDSIKGSGAKMLDQLLWWTKALKAAREG